MSEPDEGDDCMSFDCDGQMEERVAGKGRFKNKEFYGCSEYFNTGCKTKYAQGKWIGVRVDPFTTKQRELIIETMKKKANTNKFGIGTIKRTRKKHKTVF